MSNPNDIVSLTKLRDLPSNSKIKKEPAAVDKEKKVESVVSKQGTVRKKSLLRKFSDVFLNGESISNIMEYAVTDILVPAAQNTFVDLVNDVAELAVFGEVVGRRKKSSNKDRTIYSKISTRLADRSKASIRDSQDSRSSDDIVLESRADAEEVRNRLLDIIEGYGVATIDDYYSLTGTSGNWTDTKYGWTNLRSSSVRRVSGGGYILELPRAKLIED